MATLPRMTVRIAPSILHAIEYMAEREQVAPSEMARVILGAAVQAHLAKHGWERDCQSAYMRWLDARAARRRGDSAGADQGEDLEVDGEPELATPGRPVESVGPYGPTDDMRPLFDRPAPGRKPLSQVIGEADRLVATFSATGRKKRSR